ncbi:hypothetical protein [Stieleria varia]|uniref:Uncharacterized protein n=1 Tax=Stieleria varia TaxID=2528005 RepID=A0A5C6B064_9BACT|nr:hypothetical protein [Stieleria varia]TWU04666.1 hypothetical protein Pla52n_27080 [Stieleria varia]
MLGKPSIGPIIHAFHGRNDPPGSDPADGGRPEWPFSNPSEELSLLVTAETHPRPSPELHHGMDNGGVRAGWLIAQRLPDGTPAGRFLQIATGQWGPPSYATLFPLKRTAMSYAVEFGFSVGHTAEIVFGHKPQ